MATLQIGTTESAVQVIAGSVPMLRTTLDISSNLDPAVTIVVENYVSEDGGTTWEFAGGFSSVGSPQNAIDKQIVSVDGIQVSVFNAGVLIAQKPKWSDIQVKTLTKVSGGAVVTAVAVAAVPPPVV